MLVENPSIILITGIMASGKSTVAQLLSEQFDNSVHLRGDIFRRMIVNNRKEVRPDSGIDELDQLKLRYQLAAQSAEMYYKSGYTVVVQDVVIGPLLSDFISYINSRPFYFLVVLCPNSAVVATREANRAKKGYGIWSVDELDLVLRMKLHARDCGWIHPICPLQRRLMKLSSDYKMRHC